MLAHEMVEWREGFEGGQSAQLASRRPSIQAAFLSCCLRGKRNWLTGSSPRRVQPVAEG